MSGRESRSKTVSNNSDNKENQVNQSASQKKKFQKPKVAITVVKKIKKKEESSSHNNNNEDDYYKKVYEDLSKNVEEQLQEIRSTMFTREEVLEKINASGNRNKALFTQQLTVLPLLVNSVVEEYDRERLSRQSIAELAKIGIDKRSGKIKYCKSDFLRSLLHVSEQINFEDILDKSCKINKLRYFVCFIYI